MTSRAWRPPLLGHLGEWPESVVAVHRNLPARIIVGVALLRRRLRELEATGVAESGDRLPRRAWEGEGGARLAEVKRQRRITRRRGPGRQASDALVSCCHRRDQDCSPARASRIHRLLRTEHHRRLRVSLMRISRARRRPAASASATAANVHSHRSVRAGQPRHAMFSIQTDRDSNLTIAGSARRSPRCRAAYRRVARRHRITRSSRCPSNASGRPRRPIPRKCNRTSARMNSTTRCGSISRGRSTSVICRMRVTFAVILGE